MVFKKWQRAIFSRIADRESQYKITYKRICLTMRQLMWLLSQNERVNSMVIKRTCPTMREFICMVILWLFSFTTARIRQRWFEWREFGTPIKCLIQWKCSIRSTDTGMQRIILSVKRIFHNVFLNGISRDRRLGIGRPASEWPNRLPRDFVSEIGYG